MTRGPHHSYKPRHRSFNASQKAWEDAMLALSGKVDVRNQDNDVEQSAIEEAASRKEADTEDASDLG